jgi:hypothetical protein
VPGSHPARLLGVVKHAGLAKVPANYGQSLPAPIGITAAGLDAQAIRIWRNIVY